MANYTPYYYVYQPCVYSSTATTSTASTLYFTGYGSYWVSGGYIPLESGAGKTPIAEERYGAGMVKINDPCGQLRIDM